MSHANALLVALLATLFVSCGSPRFAVDVELPHVQHVTGFTIRSETADFGERVARSIEQLSPRVLAYGPLRAPAHGEVLVLNGPRGSLTGSTSDTQILLNLHPELMTPELDLLDHVVAHELVHFYFAGALELLPYYVEEGVCEWIAFEVVRSTATLQRARHALLVRTVAAGAQMWPWKGEEQRTLTMRSNTTAEFPADVTAALYRTPASEAEVLSDQGQLVKSIGWIVVDRIGFDELRALCERARVEGFEQVPSAWLLRAARVEHFDRDGWAELAAMLLGPNEREHLMRALRLES